MPLSPIPQIVYDPGEINPEEPPEEPGAGTGDLDFDEADGVNLGVVIGIL
jgi:hypothetical protein